MIVATTVEHIPTEHACAPDGVVHIIPQHPDVATTFCGVLTGKKWRYGDDAVAAFAVTGSICMTCRRIRKYRYGGGDDLGNFAAEEGVDKCPHCGCKYWEHDACVDCHTPWHPSFKGIDNEDES